MNDPEGGPWIRPVQMSPEEQVEHLAEAERLQTEAEQRAADLHAAWFGGSTDQMATWVDMPLSKMSFGWRADGYVAQRPTEELEQLSDRSGDRMPDGEPLWYPWDGPDSGTSQSGEVQPGDSPDATWWLASGLVYPNDTVRCWLADDSDVPVKRLGCWWIVEYVSRPQTLFVCVNDDEVDYVRPLRPSLLPGAPYPFDASVVDPRA